MKDEQFREFLIQQRTHWAKVFGDSKQDNAAANLTVSLYEEVFEIFNRKGWLDTYLWLGSQLIRLSQKEDRLSGILRNAYQQSRDKMWSLNKKEGKLES